MVRFIESRWTGTSIYIKAAGLSTDEKPVPEKIGTGSTFLEIDTGNVFYFDEAAGAWIQPPQAEGESY